MTILQIVEYDPRWPALFIEERDRVLEAVGPSILGLYHLGSTAVPGMPAKPKIDIFASCSSEYPSKEDHARIMGLGYSLSEHCEALGHSAYNRDHTLPAYTLHWFLEGHSDLKKIAWFKERLLRDPQLRSEYANAKRQAVKDQPGDRWAYNQHKEPFIQKVMSQYPEPAT